MRIRPAIAFTQSVNFLSLSLYVKMSYCLVAVVPGNISTQIDQRISLLTNFNSND